ncbi:MAG: hypothetical protein AAF909_09660 [Pseudomonadota bacterium]
MRQIEAHLTAIDAEIAALIDADARLSESRDILISIRGVSAVTATALLI